MHVYVYLKKKSNKIKVGRTKFHEPSEVQSSNFTLDKCTFFEPVQSYEAKQEQRG